jgi:hypothetical protein
MDLTRVYLDLWGRVFDEGVVEISDQAEFAYSSGFYGNRGVRSWRERLETLAQLGFVRVASRWRDDIHCVMLVHPDKVIQELEREGKIPELWKARYLARLEEIGAKRWRVRRQPQSEPAQAPESPL